MASDELAQGSDRSGRPLPRGLRAAVAVALVAGAAGWGLSQRGGPTTPPPGVTAVVADLPAVPPLDLQVQDRCGAALDAQGRLAVTFTVTNASSAPAALLGVAPLLPLGGLLPAGTTLAGGTCDAPTADPPGSLLTGGAPVRVTFRFRLPAGCAWPHPVLATAWVRTDTIRSAELVVLPDLGAVPLPGCPAP